MSNLTKEDLSLLMVDAIAAREKSYCPYSGKSVGAALLCRDGKIYTGANIESASFSPTVCAERVAFFRALHDGERDFVAIAVSGGDKDMPSQEKFPPCGVCRQVMAEFCESDFVIVMGNPKSPDVYTLEQILPLSFGKGEMNV